MWMRSPSWAGCRSARLRQSEGRVTVVSRYEPGVNRTYKDLAAHYGTTIMPARSRKPRDKAKVEAAVLIVQRWILARLRNRRFFSLAELNVAIWILADEQPPPDAQARCQPPRVLRYHRSSGPDAAAGRAHQ
ncbi:hypothetical protein IVB02_36090 [Bradyrhizobium sp. 166]|uniref:hypothetical protein n=1 Tax=Bradyrhizobium sp. 166 TaxID=2782638 RepID=UPI001FF72C53|nr:hypothetical protein [Bradyrhizobium sp. 166]MCK1606653.1 hypothetical protein [Bradyrhizobium sp. 166]